MTNTNELNFTVPIEVSFKFLKFNSPFKRAIIAAPTAPTDADSVGVVIQKSIEPKTNTIRVIGGITDFAASIYISFLDLLVSTGGHDNGLNLA